MGLDVLCSFVQSFPPLNIPGVNPSYDEALRDVEAIRGKLMDYLGKQKKRLACNVSPSPFILAPPLHISPSPFIILYLKCSSTFSHHCGLTMTMLVTLHLCAFVTSIS